jgi:hypothetical protein
VAASRRCLRSRHGPGGFRFVPWIPRRGNAVGNDPLLVLVQHDSGDQTQEGSVVLEHPCHLGAALDLVVQALKRGFVDQILRQWVAGRLLKAHTSSLASASMAPTAGSLGARESITWS